MKTIQDIRRENLTLLVTEFGTAAKLADRVGISPAQLSQWVNASKDSKTGTPRGMHSASARRIEAAVNKPAGWLDHQRSAEIAGASATATTGSASLVSGTSLFDRLDVLLIRADASTRQSVGVLLSQFASQPEHKTAILGAIYALVRRFDE